MLNGDLNTLAHKTTSNSYFLGQHGLFFFFLLTLDNLSYHIADESTCSVPCKKGSIIQDCVNLIITCSTKFLRGN